MRIALNGRLDSRMTTIPLDVNERLDGVIQHNLDNVFNHKEIIRDLRSKING